jgi:hypothetical protein
MFNEIPDAKAFSVLSRVIPGFLRGLLISLGCFVAAILLGSSGRQSWIIPLLNAPALAVVGIVALRSRDESGLATGAGIAFALVFFINAICGVSFLGR